MINEVKVIIDNTYWVRAEERAFFSITSPTGAKLKFYKRYMHNLDELDTAFINYLANLPNDICSKSICEVKITYNYMVRFKDIYLNSIKS